MEANVTFTKPAVSQLFDTVGAAGIRIKVEDGKFRFRPVEKVVAVNDHVLESRQRGGAAVSLKGVMAERVAGVTKDGDYWGIKISGSRGWYEAVPMKVKNGETPPRTTPYLRVRPQRLSTTAGPNVDVASPGRRGHPRLSEEAHAAAMAGTKPRGRRAAQAGGEMPMNVAEFASQVAARVLDGIAAALVGRFLPRQPQRRGGRRARVEQAAEVPAAEGTAAAASAAPSPTATAAGARQASGPGRGRGRRKVAEGAAADASTASIAKGRRGRGRGRRGKAAAAVVPEQPLHILHRRRKARTFADEVAKDNSLGPAESASPTTTAPNLPSNGNGHHHQPSLPIGEHGGETHHAATEQDRDERPRGSDDDQRHDHNTI